MTDEEFVIYRDGYFQEALNYYDRRANKNRLGYRICSLYVLFVSIALTPILTVDPILNEYGRTIYGKIIATILAPSIALAAGIETHFQFHKNWMSYRSTWDALRHELHWRDAQIHEYKGCEDRNALFVERVESLISREGDEWLKRHARKESSQT